MSHKTFLPELLEAKETGSEHLLKPYLIHPHNFIKKCMFEDRKFSSSLSLCQ